MSDDILVTAIDAMQNINDRVTDMVHCPELHQYPAQINTADLPLCFTEPENIIFGGFGDNDNAIDMVTRVYFDAFGQNKFSQMKYSIHQLMNEHICHLITESTYEIDGTKLLQKEPVRIQIRDGLDAFTMTGYTLLEYPEGSGNFYHGYEIRYTLDVQSWSCS